jgi:hypothetical protein
MSIIECVDIGIRGAKQLGLFDTDELVEPVTNFRPDTVTHLEHLSIPECDDQEFVDFEEVTPEYEELMSFFGEIQSVCSELEEIRQSYNQEPESFDLAAYRESGDFASIFQRITDAYYEIEPLADSAWDAVS